MIAADKSTWIAFFQGEAGKDVELLDRSLEDRQVLMASPALTELLSDPGISSDVSKTLSELPLIDIAALRYGLENSPVREEAEALSGRIHWYIEIQEPRMLGQALVTRVCAYLDFATDADFITIGDFADHTAEQACQEAPDTDIRDSQASYIKWICQRFTNIEKEEREAKEAEGIRGSTSGAFMIMISENGETSWLAVPTIEYVFMNKYELSQALRLGIEPDAPRYGHQIDRGHGRGFGF